MRFVGKIPSGLLVWLLLGASSVEADRLFLQPSSNPSPDSNASNPKNATTHVEVRVLRPFDVFLVAERDSGTQVSTVAYTLEMPDGLLLVGEELQVESILAMGRSTEGVNLTFRCVEGPNVPILRFRFMATRAVDEAAIRLRPDYRGEFLGIVTCEDEEFKMMACEPSELRVSAR